MNLKQIVKRALKYIFFGVPEVNKVVTNVISIDVNNLLNKRVALITGGTSGIGNKIAEAFVKSGATVIITGRDENRVLEVCNSIEEKTKIKGVVFGIELDNTKPSTFKQKLNEIEAMIYPCRIDILVNNAGVGGGDISTTTEEEFDKVINTNIKGTFFLSKVVAKNMIKNKIKGNILNVASSSSLRPATSAYTFSKWSIRGFTLGLAKILVPYGITVNGIAPGPTATPMLNRDSSDIAFEKNPVGRFAMPEEIANMAVVLVSGISKMVIGDIVYMTGGAGIITYDDIDYRI